MDKAGMGRVKRGWGSHRGCVWGVSQGKMISLDSAGDLLRRAGPGLLVEFRWAPPLVFPFITLHSVHTHTETHREDSG